jgi:hypothetical protein
MREGREEEPDSKVKQFIGDAQDVAILWLSANFWDFLFCFLVEMVFSSRNSGILQ